MVTHQIAWAITGDNRIAMLTRDFQTAPYTGEEWRLVDLTISKAEWLMALALEGEDSVIHYTNETFPMDWKKAKIDLGEGLQAIKIDASPKNVGYVVLNSGVLGRIELPKEVKEGGEGIATFHEIKGVEDVMQVSAAPDGLVWVVAADPAVGSVVKWMDPTKKKVEWHTIPGLGIAKKVTGAADGKAYVVNSKGEIALYEKNGEFQMVLSDFSASEITVGPEGRLWVTSQDPSFTGGATAYHTDDDGRNWTMVEGSGVMYLDAGNVETDVPL